MAREIKSNPFLDDDDVDDNEFLNHPRQGKSGYILSNNSAGSEQNQWEIRRQQLLEERRRIEERTLQSTNNSIGLLHESEQVGILTAEELVKQREQLENIEENLDFINSTMRTSQKHINSLKSIFGGIKNYFSKGGQQDPTVSIPVDVSERKHSTALNNTIDNLKSDTRLIKTPSPVATKSTNNIEEKLDKNLEFMSMGLGRLKNLAIGLNDEIEQQNEMIDTIHNKADKADETLEYQNRQIKRILKK
ncbi:synaptosomal-associated protein 29 [Trichonephila clavata]|uniref:Synaptosomal-associated protein 29 n=1 Tax=Trichonephila clavata TaxID=2740835 RepID=A0A8X6L5W6_TRICU|nr:synaptosomal-associated protein 29 [Trichonephila clavata]